MSLAQRFERRLEGAVGSAFARVFKGQVEPVEIGTALQREAADKRAVMGNGQIFAPNRYRVSLGTSDYDRLSPWDAQLCNSLAELVQEHLDDNNWATVGDIEVYLHHDAALHTGVFGVASRMEAEAAPRQRPYDSLSLPVVPGLAPGQYAHPFGTAPAARPATALGGVAMPGAFGPGLGQPDHGGQNYRQPEQVYDVDAEPMGPPSTRAESYPQPQPQNVYAASDPYAQDPYAQDPYAQDPYVQDSYVQDPYAQNPPQHPYGQEQYGHAYGPNDQPQNPYAQPPGYGQNPYSQPNQGQPDQVSHYAPPPNTASPNPLPPVGYVTPPAIYPGQFGPPAQPVNRPTRPPAQAVNRPAEPPRQQELRALLVIDGSETHLNLRRGSNVIGRGHDTDLQLNDQGVSRRHVDVQFDGQQAVAYDLGSTNGTSVNGHEIGSHQLRHGDVLRVGHTRLVYQQELS
jgi:hypothetical protein